MTRTLKTASTIAALGLVAATLTPITAEARSRAHVRAPGGSATAVAGPRGVAGRAQGTRTNADGSVTHASGGAFSGANGARGYRASETTVSPDGTVSRQGRLAASGAKGSVESAGGFTRSADGSWSGDRSTQATNAQTGNSYAGSTTIDPATGQPVHTGTCTNAAGEAIACH